MNDLTKGSPALVMLKFAIPVLIGRLFQLAYNLTDTRIVGSMLGTDALAAVGSVSTLHELFSGFLIGLAGGFSILTARYFGMNRRDLVRRCFASGLLLGTVAALVMTLPSLLGLHVLLDILNVSDALRPDASAYLGTLLAGLIFCVLYNVLASNLRAVGDSLTPLLFLILSAVLNVGLDLLFVGPLRYGVRGAALATVLAQAISAALCFLYLRIRYPMFVFTLREMIPDREMASQLVGGGLSMGLMSSLVSFGTVALQTAINSFETPIIVAHTATRKLTNLYMMPFSVLGATMATYCGQNYGAGRLDRIRKGLRDALLLSYLWALVDLLMSYTIAPSLITAISGTKDPEILYTAVLYQKVDTIFYLLVPTITILRNGLQGLGDHVTPVASSFLELLCKVLVAFLLTPVLHYMGIIWAEPIAWTVMVIPLIISMAKRLRKVQPPDPEEENAVS